MTDPRVVAIHEAGHALAWVQFGFGLGVVSIRPGRMHLGITIGDGPQRIILGGHPLDGLDPVQRRLADQALVVTLIGDEATDLLMPRMGRQADPPDYIADHRATLRALDAPVAPLSPAIATRLANAEAEGVGLDDYENAQDLAYRVVGAIWQFYVGWARAEARILARDHAAAIHALAAALVREQIIAGPEAVAILTGT